MGALYGNYRELTDRLFEALECDTLAIDTPARDWLGNEERMAAAFRAAGVRG